MKGYFIAKNSFVAEVTFKKDISKELMPVTWYPTKWWDYCVPEGENRNRSKFY